MPYKLQVCYRNPTTGNYHGLLIVGDQEKLRSLAVQIPTAKPHPKGWSLALTAEVLEYLVPIINEGILIPSDKAQALMAEIAREIAIAVRGNGLGDTEAASKRAKRKARRELRKKRRMGLC